VTTSKVLMACAYTGTCPLSWTTARSLGPTYSAHFQRDRTPCFSRMALSAMPSLSKRRANSTMIGIGSGLPTGAA
jgi:hypothetical protein